MLRRMLVIALGALIVSACSSIRQATVSSSTETRATELRNVEARDSVVVAIRDTVREVTTITIQTNEAGDTVKTSIVTDRERGRSRDAIATQRTKKEVVRDTVYVEKRDSIEIRSQPLAGGGQSGGTALHTTLRWIFWIIIGLIGLVIVMKNRSL